MPHQHHAGHQHHRMEKRQDQGTVVQYVYQTAAKTFDGPVAGYSTVNAPEPASTPQSGTDTSDSSSDSNLDSDSQQQQQKQQQDNQQQQQQQQQQAAQQQAAVESSSSAAVAAHLAEASSSAVAAAEASMEQAAAQTTPTLAVQTPTQVTEQAQTTPTSMPEKTTAAVKESPLSSSKPIAAVTSSPSSAVVSSPTSSFIESTSSSAPTNSAVAGSGSSSGSSGGMSGGAKAGLAIGILLAIGLLIGGIFLCYRRRKKQHASEAFGKVDDEKSPYDAGLARAQSTTSTRTTATAPRLSLRPVTQFLPDLAARGKAANAAGAGAAGGVAMASRDHNDPANPFGNHAAVAQPSQIPTENEKTALPIQANAPENPFTDSATSAAPKIDAPLPPTADVPAPLRVRTPTPESAAIAGAGVAAVGAGAGAKLAERHDAPKPLNLSLNRPVSPAVPSPVGSEFSQTSIAPGAFANGPPPSNVHRIQLDFKPSMDDELSLRAGQLVRLLHEYDDGWALCIRLDRSQQGVAPRTCLSARPVKPRPPPGARNHGPRGPPPGMMGPGQPRPASPASSRGSPAPRNRAPRPLGPGPNGSRQRSMSPGPYGGGPQLPAIISSQGGKRRSNSASEIRERRNSPPSSSPMNPNTPNIPNVQQVAMQPQAFTTPDQASSQSPPQTMARKPVPGQAM